MKLSASKRAEFDMHLAAMTRVSRPELVDILLGGMIDAMPIVETPGKLKNAAWRTLNAEDAIVYSDESNRKRAAGGSQVETIRAYIKKIREAYAECFGQAFPHDVALTLGDDPTTVDIWRLA